MDTASANVSTGQEPADSIYSAFISYSRLDEERTVWLQQRLESYRVPGALIGREGPLGRISRRLKRVFRDAAELSVGNLTAEIQSALAAAQTLIVVCSPNAVKSEWVPKEIAHFKAMGKGDRIFPVIVGGRTPRGRQARLLGRRRVLPARPPLPGCHRRLTDRRTGPGTAGVRSPPRAAWAGGRLPQARRRAAGGWSRRAHPARETGGAAPAAVRLFTRGGDGGSGLRSGRWPGVGVA